MKRFSIVVTVGLALTFLIVASSQTRKPTINSARPGEMQTAAQQAEQEKRFNQTIESQKRINRYFHGDVVAKLKTCWSGVRGNGMITLKYNYTKAAGGKWAFSTVGVQSSTLPKGQEIVALKCMQDSVRGTSFPVEGNDASEKAFVLNWTWPVPFPTNAAELTSAMFAAKGTGGGGGGTGGCDGHGATPTCTTCGGAKGLECFGVCVGGNSCVGYDTCRVVGKCASGGPFGVAGGGIFAQ